jgi:hypothetical protein
MLRVATTIMLVVWTTLAASAAHAKLTYEAGTTTDGYRFVIVSGEFAATDDLAGFAELARSHQAQFVVFHSTGGNVLKAMELGRTIRGLRLNTVQFRGVECSSACALAFLGGILRLAEPGSIGVHKASFDTDEIEIDDAVSAVQELTAELMTYISEMGADSDLLQLALRYESDDMRYLSRSEMEKYRIISGAADVPRSGAGQALPLPDRDPKPDTPATKRSDPDRTAAGAPQDLVAPPSLPLPVPPPPSAAQAPRSYARSVASGVDLPNWDFPQGDFLIKKNVSLDECRSACAEMPLCRAVTFNTQANWCYLKSRVGRHTRNENAISWIKQ